MCSDVPVSTPRIPPGLLSLCPAWTPHTQVLAGTSFILEEPGYRHLAGAASAALLACACWKEKARLAPFRPHNAIPAANSFSTLASGSQVQQSAPHTEVIGANPSIALGGCCLSLTPAGSGKHVSPALLLSSPYLLPGTHCSQAEQPLLLVPGDPSHLAGTEASCMALQGTSCGCLAVPALSLVGRTVSWHLSPAAHSLAGFLLSRNMRAAGAEGGQGICCRNWGF